MYHLRGAQHEFHMCMLCMMSMLCTGKGKVEELYSVQVDVQTRGGARQMETGEEQYRISGGTVQVDVQMYWRRSKASGEKQKLQKEQSKAADTGGGVE